MILLLLFLSLNVLNYLRGLGRHFLMVFGLQAGLEALHQATGFGGLHLLHIPAVTAAGLFLDLRGLAVVLLLQPLLHIRELASRSGDALVLLGILTLTLLPPRLYLYRLRRTRREPAHGGRTAADASYPPGGGRGQLSSEVLEFDDEIQGLLRTAEEAVEADSVNLFLDGGGGFTRALSSSRPEVVTTGEGLVYSVFRRGEPALYSAGPGERGVEPGYLTDEGTVAFLSVPVMEHSTPLGVLCADSSRHHAFDQRDLHLMELFAREIARVLKRQRIHSRIRLDYRGLHILHEEGLRLAESLDLPELCMRIVDSAERVSGGTVVLLLKGERSYDVFAKGGIRPKERTVASLKGTVLEMVDANLDPFYHPDVSTFKTRVLPFAHKGVRSVLALPLFHESRLKGILTSLSQERDAFSPQQIELLKILVNQVSVNISNVLLHEEIKMMAFTDGLTGLINHRHFQERLSDEFRRSMRFNDPLSLILIDIDHFKKVNDTYGHPVGDVVLRGVAETIREGVREIDLPARYGGEEFAVMVVKAEARSARRIAERVRKSVKDREFDVDGHRFRVTTSLGIASYPSDALRKDQLIERADRALYAAKEQGRDRTVLYSDLP